MPVWARMLWGFYIAWCLFLAIGVIASGPIRSGWGGVSIGGVFAIAAFFSGCLTLLLGLFSFRDWRPWIALLLCIVAVLVAQSKQVPLGSGG